MKKKISVLIRISGGLATKKQLGFGHIYRSINLADHLKPNRIHFALEDFGGARQILSSRGYKNVNLLEKGISLDSDIKETISLIKKKKIDILIIDRFKLKNRYVRELSKIVKTVVISDLRIIDFPAHLVINGFIGFSNQIRTNRYGAKCVVGPRYQILNRNFTKKISAKKQITLLATFGGFDENNIIEHLLTAAEKYLKQIKIKIILGPGTTKTRKMIEFEKKYKNNLMFINKTKLMHREISQARFGICSGGVTSYEFAAFGVPFAIVSQVNHQLITAEQWKRRKLAYDLGLVGKLTKKKIMCYLEKIITNKIKLKSSRIIDGFGARRATNEILKLV